MPIGVDGGKHEGTQRTFLQTFNSQQNQTWRELLKGMRTTLQNKGFSQIPQLASGKLINIDSSICF